MHASQKDHWQNPFIQCEIPPVIEKIFIETGESNLSGEAGIHDFCERMNQRFSQSNLTFSEARDLYQMLAQSGLNLNEAFGMPSPDYEPPPTEDFTTVAALKRIDDTSFEIFFVKTACGKTYFHGKFNLPENPVDLNIESIEVWRASYPC